MAMERRSSRTLSPEEKASLEQLKAVLEKALEDGKLSPNEVAHIKSVLWADGKVTYEELRTVHEMIESVTGDMAAAFEWIISSS